METSFFRECEDGDYMAPSTLTQQSKPTTIVELLGSDDPLVMTLGLSHLDMTPESFDTLSHP
jgi:hypothetical protein